MRMRQQPGPSLPDTFVIMEQSAGQGDHESGDDGFVGRLGYGWPGTGLRLWAVWLWIKIVTVVIGLTVFHVYFEPVGATVRQKATNKDDRATMAYGQ
jgi:hypothetical protein